MQEPSGAIPWAVGEHADIWNHVEAAMALLVGGQVEAAEKALLWVPTMQHADGSFPMKIVGGEVEDERGDVNMTAYIAVGVWHHWLVERDLGFVQQLVADRARRARLGRAPSRSSGAASTTPPSEDCCLLAGCSSIYQSLRAGVALADLLDDPQPEWELTGGRLGHALREHRDLFEDKSTYSMDWYYPVLGGAVRGQAGLDLLETRWDDFVVPGLGIHCVDTNPWVTGAETCELAMALDALGDHRRALTLLKDMQHLRETDGSLLDRLGLRGRQAARRRAARRLLAGRAHDVHRRGRDPGRRRARRGRRPQHRRLRDHARHLAGAALHRARARVRLPVSRQRRRPRRSSAVGPASSPAPPPR